MANQPSHGRLIWVNIRPIETQHGIPSLCRCRIPGAQSLDLRLRGSSRILSSLVRTTNIGKLIVDAVRNDVRIQGFFLAFVDKWVLGLEGEFGGRTAVQAGFEFEGWDAKPEV